MSVIEAPSPGSSDLQQDTEIFMKSQFNTGGKVVWSLILPGLGR